MFNLTEGQIGSVYYFKEVRKATSSERHLANLGFVKEAPVRILSFNKQGDYIILVKEARIALSAEVASQIIVSSEPASPIDCQALSHLKVGTTSLVEKVLGHGVIRRRLMDMGLTRGVMITIRKVAPLGDPIEISVRGYELTLRKAEAELVIVKEV